MTKRGLPVYMWVEFYTISKKRLSYAFRWVLYYQNPYVNSFRVRVILDLKRHLLNP